MSLSELFELDAVEQARLVRSGQVSALELAEQAIRNIEAANPILNAVVIKDYDRALEVAKSAGRSGSFAGVPTLLKDLRTDAEGMPRTDGSAFMKGYVGTEDSTLVKRMRAAGMQILGRTAAPEFGLGPFTEPELYGPCRNPWDTERSPGGSSGGAASAVASGMVAVAQGGDGGGSMRQPASSCGLVGLKTTRGRVSMAPRTGETPAGLSIESMMSRTVRDTAAALDAIAGPATGDPYHAPPPARPFIEAAYERPRRLRIAVSADTFSGGPVHPDVVKAFEEAAALCEAVGHEVVRAAPAFDSEGMFEALFTIAASNRAFLMRELEQTVGRPPRSGEISPLIEGMVKQAEQISAADFLTAVSRFHQIGRQYAAFFEDYDVLMTPVMSEPPARIGEFAMERGGDPRQMRARMANYSPYPKPANMTGQPSIGLPLHWSDSNLPIGMQFTGRYADEFTLLQLAAQLEEAHPWSHRRPPVWAPAMARG